MQLDKKTLEMTKQILNNKTKRNKLLHDFGFEVKEYTDEEMAYIMYAIVEQGGLKNQIKAAQALGIVNKLVDYVVNVDKSIDLGVYTMETLIDFGVVKN